MAPTTLAILQSAVLPWEQQSHPRQPGLWTETDRERGRVTARGSVSVETSVYSLPFVLQFIKRVSAKSLENDSSVCTLTQISRETLTPLWIYSKMRLLLLMRFLCCLIPSCLRIPLWHRGKEMKEKKKRGSDRNQKLLHLSPYHIFFQRCFYTYIF